jgi:hypothetical protein
MIISYPLLVEYNMYLLLGGSGLRALENYNVEDKVSLMKWTSKVK